MVQDHRLEFPEHVAAKIQKVLGISPTSLSEQDLVKLIEDLCETALMFDREESGAEQTEEEKPPGQTAAAATTQPSGLPPPGDVAGVEQKLSGGG